MMDLILAVDDGGRTLVDWLIFLAVGGICGWIASILMRTNAQMGLIANIVVGIVGAMLAGWLFPKLGLNLGAGQLGMILSAILGAVILLLLLKLLRVYR